MPTPHRVISGFVAPGGERIRPPSERDRQPPASKVCESWTPPDEATARRLIAAGCLAVESQVGKVVEVSGSDPAVLFTGEEADRVLVARDTSQDQPEQPAPDPKPQQPRPNKRSGRRKRR